MTDHHPTSSGFDDFVILEYFISRFFINVDVSIANGHISFGFDECHRSISNSNRAKHIGCQESCQRSSKNWSVA